MLPRHERRSLAEIESGLTVDDPEFARTLTDTDTNRPKIEWRSPSVVLGAIAAGCAVLCLLLGSGSGFVLASALATVLITLRNWDVRSE